MERENVFEQLKKHIDNLEQMTKETASKLPHLAQPQQGNKLSDEYNKVLEQEFSRDEMGQVFARIQIESAQKYLIELYMATPEGRKLSQEREQAFCSYKDEKLKAFLDNEKTKPSQASQETPQ